MSATTVQLLHAAADIVGGEDALAERLGIGPVLLARFISGRRELPDGLLLKAVDIILADRQARPPLAARPRHAEPARQVLSRAPKISENRARGSGAAFETGGGE